MRTATLVQATADIVTVINLRAGDVYKRLEENKSGYGEPYTLHFGVVSDVMHNGEDAVITALEFAVSYAGVDPKLKTFGTNADLKLFAAQPEEVREHFAEVQEHARLAVEKAEAEAAKQKAMANRVAAVIERVESGTPLTAATTGAPQAVSA